MPDTDLVSAETALDTSPVAVESATRTLDSKTLLELRKEVWAYRAQLSRNLFMADCKPMNLIRQVQFIDCLSQLLSIGGPTLMEQARPDAHNDLVTFRLTDE